MSLARLNQAYWTPFNDLVAVDPGAYEVLFSGDELRLDAGTTVVLSAWDLTAVGDVYLQTRTQHDRYLSGAIGVQYIEGGALQAVETPKSLTWQVPTSLDGEELIVVVDNTDEPLGAETAPRRFESRFGWNLHPPSRPSSPMMRWEPSRWVNRFLWMLPQHPTAWGNRAHLHGTWTTVLTQTTTGC